MKAPAGREVSSNPAAPKGPAPGAKARPTATARRTEAPAAKAAAAPAAKAPRAVSEKASSPTKAAPAPRKAEEAKAAAPKAAAPRVPADVGDDTPARGEAPAPKAPSAAPPGLAETQAPAPVAPEPVIQAPIRPSPPPKPLGNAGKDFRAGDHVVYPTHGVGQVQGIEEVPVAGQSLKVIVVTFEENRMTLKVPMAKAASSGLRKLASDKVMGEAMDTLRGRARIKRTMWSRRAQEYEQKINSGDPIAIAEVVRDLHRNAGQPDQSFSERQIYELALDRLAAEVGALDRTDKMAATQKLLDHLKTADKGEKIEKEK